MSKPKSSNKTFAEEKNRYTNKGPGKLAFYCDACQRQCGDKVGYERHCNSKIHLAKVEWIAQNPSLYLEENSTRFENAFLDFLKLRAGRAIEANTLYQDMVHDKDHIHMKGTQWSSLTDFVRHLDAKKLCKVDYVEGRGWYLTYVERDEVLLGKNKATAMKKQLFKETISAHAEEYFRQRETALKAQDGGWDDDTDGGNNNNNNKTAQPNTVIDSLRISFKKGTLGNSKITTKSKNIGFGDDDGDDGDDDGDDGDDDGDDGDDDESKDNLVCDKPTTLITDSTQNPSSNPLTFPNSNPSGPSKRSARHLDQLSTQPPSTTQPNSPTHPITNSALTSTSTDTKQQSDINHDGDDEDGEDGEQYYYVDSQRWKQKFKTTQNDPWMRPGLIVKITNDTLDNGRYYCRKGVVTKLFTRINKVLIPIDLTKKALLSKYNSTLPIDQRDDYVYTSPDDGGQFCVDYSLAMFAEVQVAIEENDRVVEKRLILSQKDVQTTLPKPHQLFPSQPDGVVANGTDLVAIVSGEFCDGDCDELKFVKVLALNEDAYEARVELIDEWFKEIRYLDNMLVQLDNEDTSVEIVNDVDGNDNNQNLLYKQRVWVPYDHLCVIDDKWRNTK
jgi:hypothetical protein